MIVILSRSNVMLYVIICLFEDGWIAWIIALVICNVMCPLMIVFLSRRCNVVIDGSVYAAYYLSCYDCGSEYT